MFPPIAEVIAGSAAVKALLGSSPIRFWPFGEGDPNPELPYAVWQQVYGSPLNSMSDAPDTDSFGTQIDVYAKEASEARDTAAAISTAIESSAHVVAYNGEFRDPVTRKYRYSFTADWFVSR